MRHLPSPTIVALAVVAITSSARLAVAQTVAAEVDLVVKAGTSLRVALDDRVKVKGIGDEISGTLTDEVYAYDRVVFPKGARVVGHVERFDEAPRIARIRAMLGGSFSTLRRAIVRFDAVVLDDGRRIPVDTVVTGVPGRVRRQVAGGGEPAERGKDEHPETEKKDGIAARAREEAAAVRQEIARRKQEAIDAIREPGKVDRLKEMAIERLPYHPQYLSKGTVFNASLVSPVSLGSAAPIAVAAAGMLPAPDSILTARLVTPLDSAKTPKGTPVEAVVTMPVFSADHQLILAEGSTLRGEVTRATSARSLKRNGRLRFLIESVQPPAQESRALLASLYAVAGADEHLTSRMLIVCNRLFPARLIPCSRFDSPVS